MALALNNLKRVDMPLNKEIKPNQESLFKENNYLSSPSIYISTGSCYEEKLTSSFIMNKIDWLPL